MTNETSETELLAINLHSGSYDRVTNALSLAIISLATGMEVHILLTYQALWRFRKGHLEDLDWTEEAFQDVFTSGIAEKGVTPITTKLAEAKEMGLKLYACPNAMLNMGIAPEELVDEVDELMGLVAFVSIAKTAKINWYI